MDCCVTFNLLQGEIYRYFDNNRDADHFDKIKQIGFKVGHSIVERRCLKSERFSKTSDVMRFICKDVWIFCFGRSAQSLMGNNSGGYVITDNILLRDRPDREGPFHLNFFLGFITGCVKALGFINSVTAEITDFPLTNFNVYIKS